MESAALQLLRCVTLIVLAGVTLVSAQSPEGGQPLDRSVQTELLIWRIEQPNVSQPVTEYRQFVFRPGDEVHVTADGCVNLGKGQWKKYVFPSGNNSDRLYHGRVFIPGATAGLVRLSSLLQNGKESQVIRVRNLPSHYDGSFLYLTLGYEDTNYSDNGYTGSAKSEDCKALGPAWIEFRVTRTKPQPLPLLGSADPVPTPLAPLDLWWKEVDENFLPLNPSWFSTQKPTDGVPNSNSPDKCDDFQEGPHDSLPAGRLQTCTMWDPDVDEAGVLNPYCHGFWFEKSGWSHAVHGHVNWTAVEYRGRIFFEDAQTHFRQDGDYDFLFDPEDGRAGIAEGNEIRCESNTWVCRRLLGLEFSSRETVDRMKGSGTWWETFHSLVDRGERRDKGVDRGERRDKGSAVATLNGKPALVIGLLGFDNEHLTENGAHVELHPVYGLAIKVEENETGEKWAVLARNWGNQGGCSHGVFLGHFSHDLYLLDNKLKFFFPFNGSPHSVERASFVWNYGDPHQQKYTLQSYPDGLLLSITLPNPSGEGLFWGDLWLKRGP